MKDYMWHLKSLPTIKFYETVIFFQMPEEKGKDV